MWKYIISVIAKFLYHKEETKLKVEFMNRPIPRVAIDLIKRYEGCKLTTYIDESGIRTIGYGTTSHVIDGESITEENAEDLLIEYLQEVGPFIIRLITFPMNNNQYAALLSFVYNIGITSFETSTLLKCINEKKESAIVQEFSKWIRDAKGQILPGLISRRKDEASLFLTPISK